jgi:hypothetical protein
MVMKAIVIPVEGPVYDIELDNEHDLETLQEHVGGHIEAVPLPAFVDKAGRATSYVNEEGKFTPQSHPPNMRATDFMVPGVGLIWGDYIAGTFVLVGFDPETGGHADLPDGIRDRVELIAAEAA